ncbi:MAG: SLC13 family permease [Hyphomicrobiales bacterium]|nr:MAG: SLC13 family permease [Hyphomicrobiales bacterium]
MWATFLIVTCTIICFALEKWSLEAISLASIVSYMLLFILFPVNGAPLVSAGDLVMGFGNPALVTVLALLMVGQAMFNTDALDAPSRMLARIGGAGRTRTLAILLITAGVISAFLNNTPVVVMFIPIVTAIAAQKNFDSAKALMPLSFIGILGGMVTLIGSSTNLLVAGVAKDFGIEIGFFDFSVPGLILASVGAIYVIFILPLILKQRRGMADEIKTLSGRQFIAQIEITQGHVLEGATSRAGLFSELEDITVRTIMRNDAPMIPAMEDITLRAGDTLIIGATRRALTRALAIGSTSVPAEEDEDDDAQDSRLAPEFSIAEVVVAPGSRFVGRTIQSAAIRSTYGTIVLGVQRKSRMQRKGLDQIRMEPGDTLLMGGTPEAMANLKASRDLILLEWSSAIVPMRRFATRALTIFGIVVVTAATGILPIMVASLLGVFGMLVTGCLNSRQAARAFDSHIFMLVGASLASAAALEATGGAAFIAESVVSAFEGFPPAVVLSAFFLTIAILTNVLSNNATAVIFTPIAIRVAQGIGVPPEVFVVAVIFAANCSFATPIGYQTNLLVLGPGHYRFRDFLIAGIPLVILIWLTYSFVGPWYYGI